MDFDDGYRLRVKQSKGRLEAAFETWLLPASSLKELLRAKSDELVQTRKDVNIAKLTGSSVSLGVGVPLMIAGAITIPFTFGASSALIIAGSAISGAGGLTASGASLTEIFLRKNHMKDLEPLQHEMQQHTEELLSSIIELKAVLLETVLRSLPKVNALPSLTSAVEEGIKTTLLSLGLIGSVAGISSRVALETSDDVARFVGTGTKLGASLGTAAARVALNSVFAAVAAGIDIYTIVDSALDMAKKGNKDDAVMTLERAIVQVENVVKEVNRLLRQAQGTADGDEKSTMKFAQETFTCCVCLDVMRSPIVRCPSCQALIGCRLCLDQWLVQRSTCPTCRGDWPTWQPEEQSNVLGLEEFLDDLRQYK